MEAPTTVAPVATGSILALDERLASVDPRVRRSLEAWAKRLVDLSRRNRLLYYRVAKRTGLEFRGPDPDQIVGRILDGGGWNFYEPPPLPLAIPGAAPIEPTPLEAALLEKPPAARELVTGQRDPRELDRSLEVIARRARAEFEDRGSSVLHLAWGLVRWRDPRTNEEAASPLLLIPVTLRRASIRERWVIAPADEDPLFNPALRVKLETDFRIGLPAFELDDEFGPAQVAAAVAAAVPDGWAVEPYAAVGLFGFAKEAMYRDLVDHAPEVAGHPLVRTMALGQPVEEVVPALSVEVPPEDQLDLIQLPADSYSVIDADSSQRRAIEAAIRGLSFVLHGPPGTGKSQTITNIIAEFIGRGRSVLFVSQKIAALEVVAKRLAGAELRDMILELHSAKASRAEVARELAKTLDEQLEVRGERIPAVAEQLMGTRSRLNAYVAGLHEPRHPLGMTAFEVLADLADLHGAPAIAGPALEAGTTGPAELAAIEAAGARLADVWSPISAAEAFVWRDATIRAFGSPERAGVIELLAGVGRAIDEAEARERPILIGTGRSQPASPLHRAALLRIRDLAMMRVPAPIEWLAADDLTHHEETLTAWSAAAGERAELALAQRNLYGDGWVELPASAGPDLQDAVDAFRVLTGADPDAVGLVGRLEDARAACASLLANLAAAAEPAAALRTALGLRTAGDSLAELSMLVRLGRLSQQRHRPLTAWLGRARLSEARSFVESHGPAYAAQQSTSAALLARYEPGLLEIDLAPLVARMRAAQGSVLRFLLSTYRADKRLLESLSRDRRLSATIVADLEGAAGLAAERARLRALDSQAATLLGSYARGLDTDVGAVSDALAAAEVYQGLPPETIDWNRLASVATAEAPYDSAIERESDRLERLLTAIEQALAWPAAYSTPERSASWRNLPSEGLGAAVRGFDAGLERIAACLLPFTARRSSPLPDLATALGEGATRSRIAELDNAFSTQDAALRGVFHGAFRGLDTDWEELRRGLVWASELRKLYGPEPVPPDVARSIQVGVVDGLDWGAYEDAVRDLDRQASALAGVFEARRAEEVKSGILAAHPAGREYLARLSERIDDLTTWTGYLAARDALAAMGWGAFVMDAANRRIAGDQIVPAIRRATLTSWFDSLARTDPRLSGFSREEHERLVAAFRDADTRWIRLAREQVIGAYNAQKPAALTIQGGEQAVVRREAVKKRRHVPVRTLLVSISSLLPRLKPCLMMSPLSVSHFLAPEARFDLVVFDEASQVPPEDAINCIYRGRQLIVAGDPKQLPPTDFFQLSVAADSETEAEESVDDFESVLDQCVASGLPAQPLRWHYRSRSDALIAFSNHFIYDGSLVTFPAPFARTDELGIQFVHVPEGVFDRGRSAANVVEAARVVQIVSDHVREYPHQTIGVVAFSVAQQEAIQDELARRLRTEPDLEPLLGGDRLDGFFVKNLETVQGDERDVIVFSIGYGRDETGRFYMNLGPLNKLGGARRLNVAVTRARRKVVVVSSVRAADFSLDGAGSAAGAAGSAGSSVAGPSGGLPPGPQLLRNYLDYAERGTLPPAALQALAAAGARAPATSAFEREVAAAIGELGYRTAQAVGTSSYRVDVGVLSNIDPDRFLLGIECDGAMYRSARTARDRDRLRQSVLEGLGWQVIRVWSQDWYQRREIAIERLRGAIEAAEAAVRAAHMAEAEEEEEDGEVEQGIAKEQGQQPELGHGGPEGPAQGAGAPAALLQPPPTLTVTLENAAVAAVQPGPDAATAPEGGSARRRIIRAASDVETAANAGALPWTEPYRVVKVAAYRRGIDFSDPFLTREHAERVAGLVEGEGPLHRSYAAARLARAARLSRVGPKMAQAIESGIRLAVGLRRVHLQGDFIWPSGMTGFARVRVPVPGEEETERPIDQIPPAEIDLAVLRLVEGAMSIDPASLRNETARVLGFDVAGSRVREAIEARIDGLEDRGLLILRGGLYGLAEPLPAL